VHSVTAISRRGARAPDLALDEINERAIFTFPEALAPGVLSLRLTFSGILNDKLHASIAAPTKMQMAKTRCWRPLS